MNAAPAGDPPEDEIRRLAELYLLKWQSRIHLADWDLRIVVEAVEDSYAAESHYEWRTRRGTITIPPNAVSKARTNEHFSQFMSDEQIVEESVLHELLHIVEAPLSEIVIDELHRQFGSTSSAHEMLRSAVRDWREWWIDHCTRILLDADRGGGWR